MGSNNNKIQIVVEDGEVKEQVEVVEDEVFFVEAGEEIAVPFKAVQALKQPVDLEAYSPLSDWEE